MNEFICTWGKTPIIITILTILGIFIISILMIITYTKRYKMHGKNQGLVVAVLIIGYLLPLILVFTFLKMPTKISVDNKNLVVSQIKGKISIPISEITEIRKTQQGDFANGIRTFGSGGLFGYLGKFENPQLGKFQMYVTDTKNRFIVKTKNQVYVFNCKNREKLIQIIDNQINKQ